MTTLVLDKRQLSLDYEGECLFVRGPDMSPKTVPLRQLERVICLHGVNLSTSLLGQLRSRGVDFVVHNSRYPERSIAIHADPYRSALRRVRQCQLFVEPAFRLQLAKRVVCLKLHQQQLIARRYDGNGAGPTPLASLAHISRRCAEVDSLASLRGLEGAAAAQAMAHYVGQYPEHWGFLRRQRRPPSDPVNALLSLSYTLLYRDGANVVQSVGLDPWLGFYHDVLQGRYSLACDLMEPLRPAVERFVHELLVVEKGLDRRHFSSSSGGCFLGKGGRAQFFPYYEQAAQPWRRQLKRYSRWLVKRIEAAPQNWPDAA